jgi:hypothetical protein
MFTNGKTEQEVVLQRISPATSSLQFEKSSLWNIFSAHADTIVHDLSVVENNVQKIQEMSAA